MSIPEKVLPLLIIGPFAAWIGWMTLILPIQIAIGAFRHRGGRIPEHRPPRGAGRRESANAHRAAGADHQDTPRTTPPGTRAWADDDWEPYKSKRQLQHEWYGDGNSDLNWRDRELGEALGIESGDIYKSNWE